MAKELSVKANEPDKLRPKFLEKKQIPTRILAGRPPKTVEDFPDGWKERAIEISLVGACDVEIRGDALGGIGNDLWYRLLNMQDPDEKTKEFQETISFCRIHSEMWWRRHGRTELGNKEFNTHLWAKNMAHRWKWTKSEEEGNTTNNSINVTINNEKVVNVFDRIGELLK